MSKTSETVGNVVVGIAGIIFWLVMVAFVLIVSYFSIKFIISLGDQIFGNDKSQPSQTEKNIEHQESSYVGTCTEELLKKDSKANQTKAREYCKCVYSETVSAAGSEENFIKYQNSVSTDKLVEIARPCSEAYSS